MRILVTRLRFLGDVVLSTPLLDALRERFPGASIEYLASAPHADVLLGHPSVDRLHVLPASPGPADLFATLRRLRAAPRIDWAIDLFSNPRSAVIVALSGARRRVGSDRGLRARVYTDPRGRPEGDRSAIRHHLDKLVPLLGELPRSGPTSLAFDADLAERTLRRLGLESGAYTLVHPGSTWPHKAWPLERWPQLMVTMEEGWAGRLVVLSPPGDEAAAVQVADASGAFRLPALPIPELSGLIAHARGYVGNDGGVLHMAVAHRIPTVGLFGPTEPDIWFPYEGTGPYRVVHGCDPEASGSQLTPIQVADVASAVREVLGQGGGA